MSQVITNRVRLSRRALLKGLTAAGSQMLPENRRDHLWIVAKCAAAPRA